MLNHIHIWLTDRIGAGPGFHPPGGPTPNAGFRGPSSVSGESATVDVSVP